LRDGAVEVVVAGPEPALAELESAWERAWADDAYRAELAEFVRTVRDRRESACPLAEARAALVVALASDRSRAERRPVSIEEVTSAEALAG